MTLLETKKGESYKVLDVHEEENVARRLEALGILEGTRIEVLNQKKAGATIIKVRGTRWALGEDIAKGIEVEDWKS